MQRDLLYFMREGTLSCPKIYQLLSYNIKITGAYTLRDFRKLKKKKKEMEKTASPSS